VCAIIRLYSPYTGIGCQIFTKSTTKQDHIGDLLSRFQYSEQVRETAVFRIFFGGKEVSQVMADLEIHSGYTLRSWVQLYRQKMQTGLLTLPAMKQAQKRDMAALK
jgi:transposase-like protein